MFTVNKNPTPRDLRKFAGAMFLGFAVIGLLLWLISWCRSLDDVTWFTWMGRRGQVFALCAWFWAVGFSWGVFVLPVAVGKSLYVGWMSVAAGIGLVVSTILLTVLFFLVLPVFSVIVRLGDPLRKRLCGEGSYWEDHKRQEPTIERAMRPF